MLFLCLLTVLGLVKADPSSLCDRDCPPDWKSVEGDCVMFMYGWEEDMARQVCRGLKAEFSEFFISRSDSDSATRHSLPVCLLSRETPDQTANTSYGTSEEFQSCSFYEARSLKNIDIQDLSYPVMNLVVMDQEWRCLYPPQANSVLFRT